MSGPDAEGGRTVEGAHDARGNSGPVLVVDYGAQYAQLIARRVRDAHVYSEIVSHRTPTAEMLARKPAAIILSGGPASVYANGAPATDPDLLRAGVPVFGICYGFQAMALALGGEVASTGTSEFGRTEVDVLAGSDLFKGSRPARWCGCPTTTASSGCRQGSSRQAPVPAPGSPPSRTAA